MSATTCRPSWRRQGQDPDFTTTREPNIGFEVKTSDIADPDQTYDKTMEEALDAKIEAEGRAARIGVGISDCIGLIIPSKPSTIKALTGAPGLATNLNAATAA